MMASAQRCAHTLQDRAKHMARLAWSARCSMAHSTFCDLQFGFGLRFLMLWRQWRAAGRPGRRWHVVAAASRPFRAEQMGALLRHVGLENEEGDLDALLAQWPVLLPGQHRLVFEDGAITLTLLFGEAAQTVARAGFRADVFLHDDDTVSSHQVDGWRTILGRYARHAAHDALWVSAVCEASYIQALRQCAFEPEPEPVHGSRDDLVVLRRRSGVRARALSPSHQPHASKQPRRAVVLGAGLAGANVARALAIRGWDVDVLAPDRAAHRGHAAAALTPVLARDDNARARLTRAGAALAWAAWKDLPGTPVRRVGTVQLDRADAPAQESADTVATLGFPSDWVRTISPQEAAMRAGVPVTRAGLYFAHGMLVSPDRLIDALLDHPAIRVRVAEVGHLARDEDDDAFWAVFDAGGQKVARARQVIVASAFGSSAILAASDLLAPLPRLQGMHALAGEVTYLRHPSLANSLHAIVAGEGYVLPAVDGAVTAGSTYVRGAHQAEVTAHGQTVNLGKLRGLLAGVLSSAPNGPDGEGAANNLAGSDRHGGLDGWAGWRAVVAGRLPMIGPLAHAPGVWLATAYASRGLTWAALAGEMIGAALDGEPDVIETDLARVIAPR